LAISDRRYRIKSKKTQTVEDKSAPAVGGLTSEGKAS